MDEPPLGELRAARAPARQRLWLVGRGHGRLPLCTTADGRSWPGLRILVDATLVTAHLEKEAAAPTFKGGFGYHPVTAWCYQEQPTALEQLLDEFRKWLFQERNLAASTVLRYGKTARRFLSAALRDGLLQVSDLTGVYVNAFLLRECARVSAGSAKGRVTELRFLYLRQLLPLRLGAAVPSVGGWRLAARVHPCDRQCGRRGSGDRQL